jgi:hypothetical protein
MKKRVVAYRKLPTSALQILEAQFDVTTADADTRRDRQQAEVDQ